MVEVVFYRAKTSAGRASKFRVIVDGQEAGTLRGSKRLTVPLSPGPSAPDGNTKSAFAPFGAATESEKRWLCTVSVFSSAASEDSAGGILLFVEEERLSSLEYLSYPDEHHDGPPSAWPSLDRLDVGVRPS